MPKTPEQKLEKAAGKATATLRGMLERSIEARNVYDAAIAEGRLLGEGLAAARPALDPESGYAERLRALLEDA